ncbi:amino acid ABC transporter permease [Paraburkholderia sp. SIMBA_049]
MALDWSVFCKETTTGDVIADCFGSRGDQTYLNWILSAWSWTLTVSLGALLVALIVGVAVGTLRTLPDRPWLVSLGAAWVELFRDIPLLVQIFLWYFVIPDAFPLLKKCSPALLVIVAIGLFTSARIAEQVRAGIRSLSRGQRHAALALGLTTVQTYRHVLLPMALRIIIPPLTSEAMNVVKNSSVAFAVSITELTFFARQAGEETAAPIQMYLAATVLYGLTAFGVNRLMHVIERRARIPGFGSAGAAAVH